MQVGPKGFFRPQTQNVIVIITVIVDYTHKPD